MATGYAQCAAAQRQWTEPKAPTMRVQKDVVKVSGIAQALRMPPTVMAAMAYIYGNGGYAMNAAGAEWMFETPLCRGSIQGIRERSVRFCAAIKPGDRDGGPVTCAEAREEWPWEGLNASEDGRLILEDIRIVFRDSDDLARLMTVEQAAEASEMPESLVRHALHRLGIAPSEDERFNGIALRLMLIDYCRQRRKAARSDMAKAEWERRQMVIQRTDDWRWVR